MSSLLRMKECNQMHTGMWSKEKSKILIKEILGQKFSIAIKQKINQVMVEMLSQREQVRAVGEELA